MLNYEDRDRFSKFLKEQKSVRLQKLHFLLVVTVIISGLIFGVERSYYIAGVVWWTLCWVCAVEAWRYLILKEKLEVYKKELLDEHEGKSTEEMGMENNDEPSTK